MVVLGDYIAIDASGKLNILGGGFNVTSMQVTGTTGPMYIAAIVDVPSKHLGHEFVISLELRDHDTHTAVMLPTPGGSLEAVRVQQITRADKPNIPGVYLPPEIFGRCLTLVGFANGIPLLPGRTYDWHLEVDGQHRKGWLAKFHVAGPPPAPVFGGPSQPLPPELPEL